MEQTSWNLNLVTTSGIAIGSGGSTDSNAATSIPLVLEPETDITLALQLADTTKIDVFCIVSSTYDGSIEITTDGNTFKLSGPLLLYGQLVGHFSSDLSSLTIENKSTTETANLKILISRDLV